RAVNRDTPSFPTRRSSDLFLEVACKRLRQSFLEQHLPIAFDGVKRCAEVVPQPAACRLGILRGAIAKKGEVIALENTRHQLLERDRKSTRLNSSHVKISYA